MSPLLLAAFLVTHVRADGVASDLNEPELVHRFSAVYPVRALDRGLEGWVELSFTIDANGATRDVAVVASAPARVFDAAAAAAVARWRYAPQGGERPHDAIVTFALLDAGASRTAVVGKLAEASRHTEQGRFTEAQDVLQDVRDLDDLTLIELGLVERVAGLLAYATSDFRRAAASFARAAHILAPHLSPVALAGLVRSLIVARVNSSQFAAAVRDFDRWAPRTEGGVADLGTKVGEIRAALAAGRPLQLTPPKQPGDHR